MIGDRWGVSDEEVARHYPCDDLVPAPVLRAWRGVTVHAPCSDVWPWITQIRLAPYSYDWIDNLGRRSPQELRGLSEPNPGQHFTVAGGRPTGRILSVEPGVQLTGQIMGAVMSYVLVPTGGVTEGHTRLLLKVVGAHSRWITPALSIGDLVMARRQLLNLKRLAERSTTGSDLGKGMSTRSGSRKRNPLRPRPRPSEPGVNVSRRGSPTGNRRRADLSDGTRPIAVRSSVPRQRPQMGPQAGLARSSATADSVITACPTRPAARPALASIT